MLDDSLTLSLLTWNIGYAGLDKDMDFFKDGGTKVITPKDKCLENIAAIGNFLEGMIQLTLFSFRKLTGTVKEVTGSINMKKLSEILSGYNPFFAKNYDVFFVPAPPAKPMGKVVIRNCRLFEIHS
ncbi:MAG: hypothetical protein MZV63_42990 [Marinilabiliales bacterium]|nr:hypothetical protein [Marinilabiliales bacterium]